MKRAFASNLVLLLGINFLIKPLYIFGIDREVQNAVGPEQYGLFFALLNLTYLFQIVNDFGLQSFNNRELSHKPEKFPAQFSSLLAVKFGLSLAFLLILTGAAALTGYLSRQPEWLLGIAANQVLLSLLLFLRSNLAGLGMYRADSLLSSFDKLVMIFLVGFFLLNNPESISIPLFIVCQTGSYLLAIGAAVAVLWPRLREIVFRIRMPMVRWAFRSSAPFALVMFLMYVYTYIDGVMIERLHSDGAYEAGIYASGYRLLDAIGIIGYLFAGLLLPMLSRQLGSGHSVRPLLDMGAGTLWSVAVGVSIVTFFFSTHLSEWLYLAANNSWGQVLGRLMLSFLPWSLTYIYGTLLTAAGQLAAMNRLFVGCILLNVLANLLVIPKYGAAGAALTTLATQTLAAVGQYILAVRKFAELRASTFPVKGVVLLLLVFFSTWILSTFDALPWMLRMCLALGISGFLSILLKMISIKEWIHLLSTQHKE